MNEQKIVFAFRGNVNQVTVFFIIKLVWGCRFPWVLGYTFFVNGLIQSKWKRCALWDEKEKENNCRVRRFSEWLADAN